MLGKTPISARHTINDFSYLLAGQKFREYGEHYYLLGNIKGAGGWGLNVSIIKSLTPQALKILIPAILKEKVAFKVARNLKSAEQLLSARAGYASVGKILCIYPETTQRAVQIATKLITLTGQFRGPAIPTDAHLNGCVYTYYGAFDTTDGQQIPFVIPRGIDWPFRDIKTAVNKHSIILHNAYLIRSVIKSDAKGKVYKALWIKGFRFKHCIIKEGFHDMFIDSNGRDIQERIRWQYSISKSLISVAPVPKVYELFHANGNTYLSMERIKGAPLHDVISDLHKDQSWPHLSIDAKIQLLDHLTQLLAITAKLHAAGYVHRDISPANFIVNSARQLIMIDLELVYNRKDHEPSPAFESGINGFTAPERTSSSLPEETEDIYSLGAVIAVFLTNFYPAKGYSNSLPQLKRNLKFLVGENDVVDLIVRCLHENPSERPSLNELQIFFEQYKKNPRNSQPNTEPFADFHRNITDTISNGITCLSTPLMLNSRNIWISNPIADQRLIENTQKATTTDPGLFGGVAGVFYTLAVAKQCGQIPTKITSILTANYKYLIDSTRNQKITNDPSLYYGGSGIALSLCKAVNTEFIPRNAGIKLTINQCLTPISDNLCLSIGAAGQGMALLAYNNTFKDEHAQDKLNQIAKHIIVNQNKDGAWSHGGETHFGLSQGVAGITLFLLEYYRHSPNNAVANSIHKALGYLIRSAKKSQGTTFWFVSNKLKKVTPWLDDGVTGIALAFIRGYQVFNNQTYACVAKSILMAHPEYLTSNNLGLANGIAGIGEVYLEASSALGDIKWHKRANQLATVITNTIYIQNDGSIYWAVENRRPPTPGLMTGSSGIIHFLLRNENHQTAGFPILSTTQNI